MRPAPPLKHRHEKPAESAPVAAADAPLETFEDLDKQFKAEDKTAPVVEEAPPKKP